MYLPPPDFLPQRHIQDHHHCKPEHGGLVVMLVLLLFWVLVKHPVLMTLFDFHALHMLSIVPCPSTLLIVL